MKLIRLERGVHLGCPLSPLLFALAPEPFSTIIRRQETIKGICIGQKEAKIALYADDIVCFLGLALQSTLNLDKII